MRGGAGSGKTVLALTQAKELTRGVHGMPAQRVALLCYSVGLASWFKRYMGTVDRRHRPAFVGTFEDLAAYLGVTEFGGRDDADFWENRLPAEMAERVGDLPDSKKFDSFVVDEAQDFADALVDADHALPARRGRGRSLRLQRREPAGVRPVRPAARCHWSPSCSTTTSATRRQIAEAFGPLAPMRMYARGGEGPEVTFVEASAEDALDVADDQIDPLLDEGWRPEDVALLTTGARHPEQVALQESRGPGRLLATPSGTRTACSTGTCSAARASSARSSCCASTSGCRASGRASGCTSGLSRATDKLVVVGPPDVIREMGGPAVAKKLGIQ